MNCHREPEAERTRSRIAYPCNSAENQGEREGGGKRRKSRSKKKEKKGGKREKKA